MRMRVDHAADAVYLNLTERSIRDSEQVADGIVVDYDDEGRIVGIEILDASQRTGDPSALKQFSFEEAKAEGDASRYDRPIESRGDSMTGKKHELYVERRPAGDYAVRRGGSQRASVTAPTQKQAIEKAEKLDPKAVVLVERVRDTSVGGRDKWRKR